METRIQVRSLSCLRVQQADFREGYHSEIAHQRALQLGLGVLNTSGEGDPLLHRTRLRPVPIQTNFGWGNTGGTPTRLHFEPSTMTRRSAPRRRCGLSMLDKRLLIGGESPFRVAIAP